MSGLSLTCIARLAALAYRPFLDPIQIDGYWIFMLVPLALAIAVVYKTLRVGSLRRLPREALLLTGQIIVFMALAAATLWLVTRVM